MVTKKQKMMDDGDDPISGGYDKAEAAQNGIGLSLASVDAQIFGGSPVDIPNNGKQTIRPIALDAITPDPTQPRREVPLTVRRKARSAGMAEWLVWYQMAERLAGREIPLTALLRGEGEATESEVTGQPIVDSFISLVALAASINREGLTNAITVTERGPNRYQVETGERRYQAYKLLYGALHEEQFSRIAARVETKSDVWKQASENGSRKPLNAIGMARQLALLIMELNKGRDGISYASFDSFEGDCDRMFYAQVANGVVHRIPKGVSERILQATGLKSQSQIAHYRALLSIPDELWMTADEEDRTEGWIREQVKPQTDTITTVMVSPANPIGRALATDGHLVAPNGPLTYPLKGDGQRFMLYRGERVQLERSVASIGGRPHMRVWLLDSNGGRTRNADVPMSLLSDITPAPIIPGLRYRNAQGRVFHVISLSGNMARVNEYSQTGQPMRGTVFNMSIDGFVLLAGQPQIPDWLRPGVSVVHDFGGYRYEGTVSFIDWDTGDFRVKIRTAPLGKVEGWFQSKNLRLVGGQTPAEPTEVDTSTDRTPPGDWKAGMQVITHNGKHGVVTDDATGRKVWVKITGVDLDAPQPFWSETLRLAEGDEVDQGAALAVEHDLLNGESNDTAATFPLLTEREEEILLAFYVGSSFVRDEQAKENLLKHKLVSLANPGPWTLEITELGIAYLRAHRLITDIPDDSPSAPADEPPPLPEWAADDRLVLDIERTISGTVISSYWNSHTRVWMVRADFGDHVSTVPLDRLFPAWAAKGNPVLHMGGQSCEILEPIYAGEHFLKVFVLPNNGEETASLNDFMPIVGGLETPAAAPAPRHPGMEAKNISRQLLDEQSDLRTIADMANSLRLWEEAALITKFTVLTPIAIDAYLRQGEEAAVAQIEAMYRAAYSTLERALTSLNATQGSALELIRQKVAALQDGGS